MIKDTDVAVCPHCGSLNYGVFPMDLNDEDTYQGDAQCKKCNKEFKWRVEVEIKVTFSTEI